MTRKDAETLLDCCWGPRARRSEQAHYRIATKFSFRNRWLSYLVIALAVVTSSSLFAELPDDHPNARWVLAGISMLAAFIVGYQRSADYAARSTDHQRSGADWGGIVSRTEMLRKQIGDQGVDDGVMNQLSADMDAVTKRSPQIPKRMFNKCKISETYLYDAGRRVCPTEP